MRQYLITAESAAELSGKLQKMRAKIEIEEPTSVLVRAFLIEWKLEKVEKFSEVLRQELPMAEIVGCGSNGSIVDSKVMEGKHLFVVTLFDKTKLITLTYEFGRGYESVISNVICGEVDMRPNVRAVELFTTLLKFDAPKFLGGIHFRNKDIKIFGSNVMGVVPNANENIREQAFIMSKNGVVKCGAVAVIYLSDCLQVSLYRVLGWKPLGMELEVTKSETRVVKEINNKPAYEVYRHFLEIPNDENFVANTIGFPLMSQEYNYDVLRIPADCTKEGYLISNAGIPQGRKLRLTYGNPGEIIDEIRRCREEVRKFKPEVVLIYDCILRKVFWNTDINIELGAFEKFPATAGFFSEGELSSVKEGIIHNECTFLTIAMKEQDGVDLPTFENEQIIASKEVSMIKRMATFIEKTTFSLNSAYQQLSTLNRQLQLVNVRLSYMALTDELTQLFNRREIEQRIHSAFVNAKMKGSTVALIMVDIDFFKKVNDTYGHATGDMVLREVAHIIHDQVNEDNDEAAGRWGGEEFIVLLPGYDSTAASKVAEKLRHEVETHEFTGVGQRTVSVGVTAAKIDENEEDVFIRADNALYKAKESGRNRVVVL